MCLHKIVYGEHRNYMEYYDNGISINHFALAKYHCVSNIIRVSEYHFFEKIYEPLATLGTIYFKKNIIEKETIPIWDCYFCWCEGRDLNPHDVTHSPLKRARLPIPPPSHTICVLIIFARRVC